MRKNLGICLTGGGARGAYQAGALKALNEANILSHVNAYAGTSIGAANAACLVSSSVKKLEDIWFNIPDDALKHEKPLLSRLLEDKLKAIDQGIYSMDTFSSIMMKSINQEALSKKRVYVTVSDGGDESKGLMELIKSSYRHYMRKDSKVIYLPLDELTQKESHKAVVASCSIPVIFPAVKNQHKKYYDGGVFDNIPIKPLIAHGCDEIIIIHLNRTLFFKPEDHPEAKIWEIKHKGSLGNVLDFSKAHVEKLFNWGYEDAKEFLKEYTK
jgi:NTE family protein